MIFLRQLRVQVQERHRMRVRIVIMKSCLLSKQLGKQQKIVAVPAHWPVPTGLEKMVMEFGISRKPYKRNVAIKS